MKEHPGDPVYVKRGRRYQCIGTSIDYSREFIPAGQVRLMVACDGGWTVYEYGVTPDNAAFRAAATLAAARMEAKLMSAMVACPVSAGSYTPKQLEIIERFQAEMSAAGALMPDYWVHLTPREVVRAAIGEVNEA